MEDELYCNDLGTLFDLCKNSLHQSNKIAIEHYFLDNFEIKSRVFSYKDLEDASSTVADMLASLVPQTTPVIGLLLHPSLEMIACILGITRLKYIFAPLEMSPSVELLNKMINSLKMTYLITTLEAKSQTEKTCVEHGYGIEVDMELKIHCGLDRNLVLLRVNAPSPRKQDEVIPKSVAYVVHTSGTTGTPKVICVPHSCVLPNIVHLAQVFDVGNSSKVAMMSPPTFDPSIIEIFMSLAKHATLIVPSAEIKLDPVMLLKVLFKIAKVTVLQATPALIGRFSLGMLRNEIFVEESSLNVMAFGGEPCPPYKVIHQWINASSIQKKLLPNLFYNIYGITEVSSWATYFKLPEKDILESSEVSVPLGLPLLKTCLQVRKEETDSLLCTIDSAFRQKDGNLCLSSLSCEWKFSQDLSKADNTAFQFSGKIYIGGRERRCYILGDKDEEYRDSGDLVNVCITGEAIKLNYFGRTDAIVKRHGQKVNLQVLTEEIMALSTVKASYVLPLLKQSRYAEIIVLLVRQAVKDIKHEQGLGLNQPSILSTNESKLWTFDCFKTLSRRLNHNALPDRIVEVTVLPVTPHGKVNAKLLLHLYEQSVLNANQDCFTEEYFFEALSMVLPECLPRKICNRHCHLDLINNLKKSFTQLGGDSFSAVLLINWLDSFLGISITKAVPDVLNVLLENSFEDFIKYLTQKFNDCNQLGEMFSTKRRKIASSSNESSIHVTALKEEHCVVGVSRTGRYNKIEALTDFSETEDVKKLKGVCGELNMEIKEFWRYNTEKCIDASPLITYTKCHKGICFIGSHSHKFSAISLKDGEEVWNVDLPDRIESSACLYKDGHLDIVVVGCYDGYIYCLKSLNGEVWWKFKTNADVKSSPCWDERSGLVFVGSHDGHLYALNIKQRELQWRSYCGGGAVFSSPATWSDTSKNQSIVVAATLGGNLLCFSCETGEEIWSYQVGKPFFSSPCINHSGICIGCVDCCVYFFSLQGEVMWSFRTGQSVFSSPCFAIDSNSIVIGSHDGKVYKIKTSDGSLLWKTDAQLAMSPIYSSPFPVKNECDKEFFIFASTSGVVYIVEENAGSVVAKKELPGEVFSSPVVHFGDLSSNRNANFATTFNVLVGCRDNNLYCFSVSNP